MTEAHKQECARSLRHHGLAEGWDEERIANTIYEHCGTTLLRAHRLARGWTLEDVAAELRSVYIQQWGTEPAVSHQRVSRWENDADTPSARYLEALCRLYRSRPDRLGFGHDYTQPSPAPTGQLTAAPQGFGPAPAPAPGLALAAAVPRPAAPVGDPGLEVLEPTAADCGSLPPQLLGPLRDARAQADALLETQSVSAATVDWWEQIAEEYPFRRWETPIDVFVARRLLDFRHVQSILSQRQPLEFQMRLCRVVAQLAGQIGQALTALGALRESLGWCHTARLAADEAGDRRLRAKLMAFEALAYFWEPHPAERAIALCETAKLMSGPSPTVTGTFAASLQARAYARLGRRREALETMHRAEIMFGRLNISETDPSRFIFDEQRLWYDRQNTLTRLGEIDAATQARENAVRLTPADTKVDPVQMQLDEASCLIAASEISEGCALACQTLAGAGNELAGGLMWVRARQIDDVCRSRGIRVESARSLHQMVTQAARQSRPLSDGRDGWYRLLEAGSTAGNAVGPKMLN